MATVSEAVQKIMDVFKACSGAHAIVLGDVVRAIIPGGPQGKVDAEAIATTFKGLGLVVEMVKYDGRAHQFKNADGSMPVQKVDLRPGDYVFKVMYAAPALKVGDRTDDGRIVQHVTPEGEILVDKQPSTASAIHKRATTRTEKRMSMFGNLIHGSTPAPVEKSADVSEFEFKDGVLRRADSLFSAALDSPKPSDATGPAVYDPTQFPSRTVPMAGDGHGNPIDAVPQPYDVNGAGNPAPHFLNFETPGKGGGLRDPANYNPSVPGRNPADGPGAVDLRDVTDPFAILDDDDEDDMTAKSVRLGFGHVLKNCNSQERKG